MLYLVTYDLKDGAPTDYQALYDEFATFDGCIRCLESSWLVKSELRSDAICNRLRAKMGLHDHIIVVPYDNNRSSWLPNKVVTWIRENQGNGESGK